jgi:hypothetical protein
MSPLFALEPFMTEPEPRAPRARTDHRDTARQPETVTIPGPVSYSIEGIFRFGNGDEQTRTVQGQTLNTRMAADITMFVTYLADAGWLFADGRAVLVQLLGARAEDGTRISLGNGQG